MGRPTKLTKGFTDLYIKNLKPQEKRYYQREGRGFAILVLPSGHKTWVYIYTLEGKTKYENLGTYPEVTLAQAREKYQVAYTKVQNGIPLYTMKVQLLQQGAPTEDTPVTFKDFAELYIQWSSENHVALWHENIKGMLSNDVLPKWGATPIRDITRRNVISLLEGVSARAPGRTPNLQRCISGVFDYALQRDYLDSNPTYHLSRAVPSLKPKARTRVLSDEELKHIWSSLGNQKSHRALRLILFTAQRPGEVAGLHRSEISGTTWTIPQERAEKGTGDHLVHLTKTALEIIGDTPGPIFDITRGSISRTVNSTMQCCGLPRWTPHDLRRTARTMLARLGVIEEVAEAVIAHKKKGIKAVYNLYEYWPEKKAALELLEQELLRILQD